MDAETINALWPDFVKENSDAIRRHIRKRFLLRELMRYDLKVAHLQHDDRAVIFCRGEIIGYAKIEYSEPCLIFVPK